MAGSLGQAYVQIVPSAQGISGSIQNLIKPEATKAGSVGGTALIGKMKGLIAGAAIGTTIVAGIKKSIGEGAALQQSMGGIETLFKGSADTVIKNAKQAYKTAGMSANEYMENVTSFSAGLIKSVGGDTEKAAKAADMAMVDMSDNANKMGTDIESIQNAYQGFAKKNYTMLDNLKLGYGGTKEEMQRLLEDAGKITGKKYDMSNLNDVYEAIHVIQEEMDITGTTAEEASQTISGSFGSLKAAFSDFMGNLALGEDVGPAMQNLIDSAVTFLAGNLIPAIVNIMMSLPEAIGSGIMTASSYIPQDLTGAMQSGLDAISAKLPDYLNMGVAMVTNVCNGIIEHAPDILDAAGQAVTAFADFLAENNPKINEAAGELMANVGVALVKNLPKIAIAWARFQMSMNKAILKIVPLGLKGGMQMLKAFGSGVVKAASPIITKARSAMDKVTSPFKKAVEKIKGFFPINVGKIMSNIHLPKFNVSGGKAPFGIGGKGSLPKFNVVWNAEGAIVDGATLIGAGEAGREAIVPLDPFWKRLDQMKGGNTINITMNVDGAKDPASWAKEFSRSLELEMRTI